MAPHDAWVSQKDSEGGSRGGCYSGEWAQGLGPSSSYSWIALAEHGGVCLLGLDADTDAREDTTGWKARESAAGIAVESEACTRRVAWIGEDLFCQWTTMCT